MHSFFIDQLVFKERHITKGILLRRNIMATLAEIRAKLQQSNQNSGSVGLDNSVYPHWNITEGQTATLRFLQDGDPSNSFFWVERAVIRLPFAGIKGEMNSKPVVIQVPCMEMWNETCPILTEVRTWFKDESLTDMGRKYWKKKSYLFQGFVVDSKYQEEKTPENPIRRFIMGGQIFNIIKNALLDPEIEELPTDYVRGLDFKVSKTKKGEYFDYNTSSWARRERALSQTELEAIEKYGLYNLKDFLPKKPTDVELKVIKEMFEASVDGEAYDGDRWSKYYKPSGYGSSEGEESGATTRTVSLPKVQPKVEAAEDSPPWEEPAQQTTQKSESSGKEASSRAADIIAMIRNRQKSE
jgi:hypothetical protein